MVFGLEPRLGSFALGSMEKTSMRGRRNIFNNVIRLFGKSSNRDVRSAWRVRSEAAPAKMHGSDHTQSLWRRSMEMSAVYICIHQIS